MARPLAIFKARNKPFVLVVWSRDPDGSQHNQGDSLGNVVPGINLARLDQERRQQPRTAAQGARRAGARAIHQHHRVRRPRLLDDLEGEHDEFGGLPTSA